MVKNNLIHEVLFLMRNVYLYTQFLPKAVLKLLRDCKSKIECLKDHRGICFCTRTPQIDVIIYCFKWGF